MPEFKRRYWQYQFELGRQYLIPLLREWGFEVAGKRVVDLGCAEGGVLVAFVEAGAEGIGLEISPSRAQLARRLAAERGHELQVVCGDLLKSDDLARLGGPFDLVLLRDVLEHVDDKLRALQHVRALTKKGSGRALITFPPFYSPFGGHQQMLGSFFRFLPYWHALPGFLYRPLAALLRRFDPQPHILREMELFRRDRLTISHFERLARQAGLQICRRRFYLSRPSHKLRYGWPVVRAGQLNQIPIAREVLVSGAFFLLEPVL